MTDHNGCRRLFGSQEPCQYCLEQERNRTTFASMRVYFRGVLLTEFTQVEAVRR